MVMPEYLVERGASSRTCNLRRAALSGKAESSGRLRHPRDAPLEVYGRALYGKVTHSITNTASLAQDQVSHPVIVSAKSGLKRGLAPPHPWDSILHLGTSAFATIGCIASYIVALRENPM